MASENSCPGGPQVEVSLAKTADWASNAVLSSPSHPFRRLKFTVRLQGCRDRLGLSLSPSQLREAERGRSPRLKGWMSAQKSPRIKTKVVKERRLVIQEPKSPRSKGSNRMFGVMERGGLLVDSLTMTQDLTIIPSGLE